jgi:hypothetical protein
MGRIEFACGDNLYFGNSERNRCLIPKGNAPVTYSMHLVSWITASRRLKMVVTFRCGRAYELGRERKVI